MRDGIDQPGRVERRSAELLDQTSAPNGQNAVGDLQHFLEIGRCNKQRFAGGGNAADQAIDFFLGADIDALSRLIQQKDSAEVDSHFDKHELLLVPAGQQRGRLKRT